MRIVCVYLSVWVTATTWSSSFLDARDTWEDSVFPSYCSVFAVTGSHHVEESAVAKATESESLKLLLVSCVWMNAIKTVVKVNPLLIDFYRWHIHVSLSEVNVCIGKCADSLFCHKVSPVNLTTNQKDCHDLCHPSNFTWYNCVSMIYSLAKSKCIYIHICLISSFKNTRSSCHSNVAILKGMLPSSMKGK